MPPEASIGILAAFTIYAIVEFRLWLKYRKPTIIHTDPELYKIYFKQSLEDEK